VNRLELVVDEPNEVVRLELERIVPVASPQRAISRLAA
jgi:hypothetical protein